jgi:methionyl-tRNA formyltransferase
MLAQRALAITDEDDSQSLHDRLAQRRQSGCSACSKRSLREGARNAAACGRCHYAPKIRDGEAVIDWSQPAVQD